MDDFLNSNILQFILAIATFLGGISAFIHLFFNKNNKIIEDKIICDNKNYQSDELKKTTDDFDVYRGIIESFRQNLLINGEVLNFNEVKSYSVKYFEEKVDHGNIFIHIIFNIFKGIGVFLEQYEGFVRNNIKLLLSGLLFLIIFFVIDKLFFYFEIQMLNTIFEFIDFLFGFLLFSVLAFTMGYFLFLTLLRGFLLSLSERFFIKEKKLYYLEIITSVKRYKIWVSHAGDGFENNFENFNKVHKKIKEAMFNDSSEGFIIELGYDGFVSIRDKANKGN